MIGRTKIASNSAAREVGIGPTNPNPLMPEVTLRQIAERIGCSRSTVSYALRNSPGVSKETQDRVLEAAAEMGWRPNAELNLQMATIRKITTSRRSPTIAVVINMAAEELKGHKAPGLQMEGAKTRAEELGFQVDEFNLVDNPLSPKRLKGILRARGIQGIVFVGTIVPPLPMEVLEVGTEFTCVVSGIRYPSLPFHVTVPDFLAAGRTALQEIVAQGFKRPGVIISRTTDRTLNWGFSGGVFTGLMEVAEENRLPMLFIEQDGPEETTEAWLKQHRPDCVLTLDVHHTTKTLKRLGDETPCFSMDWYPDHEVLGGMDLMQRDIGRAAVNMVVDQLSRGEVGLPSVQHCLNVEGIWATKKQYYESHF